MLGLPGGSAVKNLLASARDAYLILESGRSPREGSGNPLQYSDLGNPIDRGAWRTTVHWVTKSRTRQRTQGRIDPFYFWRSGEL